MGIIRTIFALVGAVVGALVPVAQPDEVLGVVVDAAPGVVVPGSADLRGLDALASLPVSVESLGFTISFHDRSDPGGLLWPDRSHIEIFVSSDQPESLLRHIIAHEIGHAVDLRMNDRADHDAWRAARGIPGEIGWWAAPYASDFDTPGGDFAECFASWIADTPSRSKWGSCAGTEPLMAQLASN